MLQEGDRKAGNIDENAAGPMQFGARIRIWQDLGVFKVLKQRWFEHNVSHSRFPSLPTRGDLTLTLVLLKKHLNQMRQKLK